MFSDIYPSTSFVYFIQNNNLTKNLLINTLSMYVCMYKHYNICMSVVTLVAREMKKPLLTIRTPNYQQFGSKKHEFHKK